MIINLTLEDFNKRIGANVADASNGILFQAENKINISGEYRSLIIGVGGSGCATVNDVKRVVQSKLADWENYVGFLAIDADRKEIDKWNHLVNTEKHVIECMGGANNRWHEEDKRLDAAKQWVRKSFNTDVQSVDGAKRIRQAARARLYDWGDTANTNDNQLLRVLKRAVDRLTRGNNYKLQVYIVLGVAGGTGSGLLIDIADLTRRALPPHVTAEITGFFYLPDTVEEFFSAATAARSGVHANGYAALKELDYYFSLFQRGSDYPEYLKINKPYAPTKYFGRTAVLYDMVFLISGSGNQANLSTREAVAESLVNIIAEASTSQDDNRRLFLISSFLANKNAARSATMGTQQEVGGIFLEDTFDYCSIGVGTASIPDESIKSYAISKLAKSFYEGVNPWSNKALNEEQAKLAMERLIISDPNELSIVISTLCNKLKYPPDSIPPTNKEILAGTKEEEQIKYLNPSATERNASIEIEQFLSERYQLFRTEASVSVGEKM